jgi:hypothetical protein
MPFLFDIYGARIRQRCRYAREAAGVAEMMKARALKQREMEKGGTPEQVDGTDGKGDEGEKKKREEAGGKTAASEVKGPAAGSGSL